MLQISWGKIRLGADPVKLYAEATLVFPLIVAQTFAKLPKLTPVLETAENDAAEE
jgi:deoxyhypusine synthase